MRGLLSILLIGSLFILPTLGRAETTLLCQNVLTINQIHAQSTGRGRVENPAQVTELLASLVVELEERIDRVSLYRLKGHVFEISALLSRIETQGAAADERWNEQALFHLTEATQILGTVDEMFGCSQPLVTTQVDLPVGPEDDSAKRPLEVVRDWVEQSRPALKLNVAILGIVAAIFLSAATAYLLLKSRGRELRRSCHTFVLSDFAGVCSLSHIVDIASKGFKIEAPVGRLPQDHANFYFAGEVVTGHVVWSNTYYAGVRFRRRISSKLINRVVDVSNESVEESGLASKALSCFAPGCHEKCPRYSETAIDVSEDETNPDEDAPS